MNQKTLVVDFGASDCCRPSVALESGRHGRAAFAPAHARPGSRRWRPKRRQRRLPVNKVAHFSSSSDEPSPQRDEPSSRLGAQPRRGLVHCISGRENKSHRRTWCEAAMSISMTAIRCQRHWTPRFLLRQEAAPDGSGAGGMAGNTTVGFLRLNGSPVSKSPVEKPSYSW